MVTTWGMPLAPTNNRLSHSYPRTRDLQATGLMVEPFAATSQASRFAGTHRAQTFQLLAFRLFHHETHPDAQRCFTLLLDLLTALLGFLPQDLFDHLGLPAWVV